MRYGGLPGARFSKDLRKREGGLKERWIGTMDEIEIAAASEG